MKQKIRLLIVDDHAMVRLGLAQAMEYHSDIQLVAEAGNGPEALELYREHRPDVVTMDYQMPGTNGVESTALLRAEFPEARVLLVSVFEGDDDVWRATQAGAVGYVSKSATTAEIIKAIRTVAAGETYISEHLAKKLAARKPEEALTTREYEVLRELVAGRTNKEIMSKLGISENTVKTHLKKIFAKLHVLDRIQAVKVALERGLVHLDEL